MKTKAVSGIMLALLLVSMLTLTFNIPLAKSSEPPPTEWTRTYGGAGYDSASSVVQTSDGGYAIAGTTSSFGVGGSDFWLVKTDSAGNMQWNKTYGGTGYDSASSVVQTSDGGYAIAGTTQSFGAGFADFWLVKTDSAGNMEWDQTYGGADSDGARCVIQTSDGGYALAGNTYSYGVGYSDFWLVKTDSAGNMEWNKTYGGPWGEYVGSVVETVDGGYAIVGSTASFGYGMLDFWLVKTDSAGNMEWSQAFGSWVVDYAHSVVQTSDGGYAIAGQLKWAEFCYHFCLLKYNSAGNKQWSKYYGEEMYGAEAYSVVQTVDGGYAMAGYTYFGAGGSDFWLVKTDSAGNMEWNKTYGGTGSDCAYSLVQTSDGGYAMAGRTDSFGAGGSDFWLVKIACTWTETIYIRADGSVDPPTAPISSVDNITYNLTCDILTEVDGIVVERDNIVVDGAGYTVRGAGSGYGIYLPYRNNVTLRDVEVTNFDYGISLYHSSNNNLIGNNAYSNGVWGIYLRSSSYNNLSGNIAFSSIYEDGIRLHSSSNNVLSGNNVFSNDVCGIYLGSSSNNTLIGNNVFSNDVCGIYLGSSSNNTLIGNNAYSNKLDGIRLDCSSNNTLIGNNAYSNKLDGIWLDSSSNNNLIGNNAYSNGVWGIYLRSSSYNNLSGNIAFSSIYEDGIRLHSSSNNVLSGNTVFSNDFCGIYLGSSSNNTLIGNNAYSNSWGIWLEGSSNNVVSDNTLSTNSRGITLDASSNNILSGNNVSNNVHGIWVIFSGNNTLIGNTFYSNKQKGIWLDYLSNNNVLSGNNVSNNGCGIWLDYSCSNNTLFHNNLVNNTVQAHVTSGYVNTWDNGYPSGGNYWSDYTGVDRKRGPHQNKHGSDGIGDTPYVIDENNQDNYPLMNPWPPPPPPQKALEELIETIKNWNLSKGTEYSLTSKLEEAILLLNKGNKNGAIHKLMDFVNQVEALRDEKLTNEQADYLIAEARRIIDLIKG